MAPDVVRAPPTDAPAIEDDTTARLFTAMTTRVTSASWALLTLVAGAAATVWLWSLVPVIGMAMTAALCVLAWQVSAGPCLSTVRWPKVGRAMLSGEPWRPVGAVVRGATVTLADGTLVRVWDLPPPARMVIARTGRVWLVGPDAHGWAALRVDGLHTPWPAHVRGAGVRLQAAGPTGMVDGLWSGTGVTQARAPGDVAVAITPVQAPQVVAGDDPVVAALVRHLARRRWGEVAYAVLSTAALCMLAILAALHWLALVTVATGAVVAGLLAWRLRNVNRLATLLTRGPWQRAEAMLTDGVAAVRMADGTRFTVDLRDADFDVTANVYETESVWVAGSPEAVAAVGFPGYPILAAARFTPAP
jgi:hypothetical protein